MPPAKQILALNRFDPTRTEGFEPALADMVARRASTFGPASVLVYEKPIVMERAEGVWMYDADGRRYLDVYNNVPSVGHCHPRVVEAIAAQAAKLNTHTRYLFEIQLRYAERLLATYPAGLTNLMMTCTGSESNDLALQLARAYTGRRGVIVTATAYHGNTTAVAEVSPSSFRTRTVPSHVRVVPAPVSRPDPAEVAARFAADVTAAMRALETDGHGCAALLVDSIFSSDGVYADPPGFLAAAVEAVHAAGGLFIADEVQPGFGRTGAALWGFARHGVTPDIVTMGKPMGNGFPMGGVVTRPGIFETFCAETGYFNTFGGNPVASAAGLAVLDVIDDEGLRENAQAVGGYLKAGLEELAGNRGAAEVRGAGLFIGYEFRDPENGEPDTAAATRAINRLKERGILIGAAGAHGNTLKIRPPLCFSRDNADFFIDNLAGVLAESGRA